MYRSNPISAHPTFLSLNHSPIPGPSLTTFYLGSSFHFLRPSFYFALLWFCAVVLFFVIFILNMSELAEAHVADVLDVTYTQMCKTCMSVHTYAA